MGGSQWGRPLRIDRLSGVTSGERTVGDTESASLGEREDGGRGGFSPTWVKALWESGEILESTHGLDLLAPAPIVYISHRKQSWYIKMQENGCCRDQTWP